jgi:hypothetical protein
VAAAAAAPVNFLTFRARIKWVRCRPIKSVALSCASAFGQEPPTEQQRGPALGFRLPSALTEQIRVTAELSFGRQCNSVDPHLIDDQTLARKTRNATRQLRHEWREVGVGERPVDPAIAFCGVSSAVPIRFIGGPSISAKSTAPSVRVLSVVNSGIAALPTVLVDCTSFIGHPARHHRRRTMAEIDYLKFPRTRPCGEGGSNLAFNSLHAAV